MSLPAASGWSILFSVTNRDRRKVVGGIFADAAKYSITAGTVALFLAGKLNMLSLAVIGLIFSMLTIVAYFVTPKDQKEG